MKTLSIIQANGNSYIVKGKNLVKIIETITRQYFDYKETEYQLENGEIIIY